MDTFTVTAILNNHQRAWEEAARRSQQEQDGNAYLPMGALRWQAFIAWAGRLSKRINGLGKQGVTASRI